MKINQILHGYQQGHNKIVGSINLSPTDEDRIKVLSDWTEYAGGLDGDMSYITTYPLTKDNIYVVAKTWYADEMSRPGCVWTHSLILDLSCIDDTFDFRELLRCFHRPVNDEYSYDRPIDVAIAKENSNLKIFDFNVTDVWTLYNDIVNHDVLLYRVEDKSEYYQYLILSLLQYMPVDVIKTSRLCSGDTIIRKDGNIEFNLVFSSLTGKLLSSQSPNISDDSMSNKRGTYFICDSLCKHNNNISQLIHLFSNDVDSNAQKINVLGELLCDLNKAFNGEAKKSYKSIIQYIASKFPTTNDGATLKQLFFGEKIGNLFTSKEDYFVQLSSLSNSIFANWSSIGFKDAAFKYITSSSDNLISLLDKLVLLDSMNTEGKKIISDAAKIVTIPTLKILSDEHWNVFRTLISASPALLCNDFWLSLSINKVAILLHVIENIAGELINYWNKILNYVLQHRINISSNFASKIHSFYPQAISDILDFMQLNANVRLTRNIDNLCITYTAEVIKWVELKDSYTPTTIRYIIHTVSPVSDTTRAKGVTPWVKFAGIDLSLVDINYQIFLFILSLNWKSTNALNILKSSFYIIHLALSKDELSYQKMNLLRPYFAELPFWQNWDNCKKLRKGVVKAMKRLSYTRNNIEHFTPSEELNTILLKIWDK